MLRCSDLRQWKYPAEDAQTLANMTLNNAFVKYFDTLLEEMKMSEILRLWYRYTNSGVLRRLKTLDNFSIYRHIGWESWLTCTGSVFRVHIYSIRYSQSLQNSFHVLKSTSAENTHVPDFCQNSFCRMSSPKDRNSIDTISAGPLGHYPDSIILISQTSTVFPQQRPFCNFFSVV